MPQQPPPLSHHLPTRHHPRLLHRRPLRRALPRQRLDAVAIGSAPLRRGRRRPAECGATIPRAGNEIRPTARVNSARLAPRPAIGGFPRGAINARALHLRCNTALVDDGATTYRRSSRWARCAPSTLATAVLARACFALARFSLRTPNWAPPGAPRARRSVRLAAPKAKSAARRRRSLRRPPAKVPTADEPWALSLGAWHHRRVRGGRSGPHGTGRAL